MATNYNLYQHYIYTAIDLLMKKGLIKNDLDWDVNRGKFTLRLSDGANRPLRVIITEFRRKDSTIVVTDAKTHVETGFHIISADLKNKDEFHKFIIDYISGIQ